MTPAECPRCGQPVDPLDPSCLINNKPAHIICPLPDLPAA